MVGLSVEEVADLEQARDQIRHYEKLYSIFEHASNLGVAMTILETRIAGNVSTMPLNMYKWSHSSSFEKCFPEIEQCLEAYYELIDDCEGFPDWQKKIEWDLGGVVSYMCLTIGEQARDAAVAQSPIYRRFDSEKQKYFK